MLLKKIQLISFRNFEKITLDVEENINIFLGKNGEGKTSLLEAIAMLSMPKSFRTSNINDMIRFSSDYFRVIGIFNDDDGEEKKLEIAYQSGPRKQRSLKINNVKKSTKEFLSGVYIATFVPEDLYLLDLGPTKRREYINRVLSKLDFMYLDNLSRYERAMKERNAVLRRINEGLAGRDELEAWDRQLIDSGVKIIKKRLELLFEMSGGISKKYTEIAAKNDSVYTAYVSKIHEILGENHILKYPFETTDLEELFRSALEKRVDRDIATKVTSVGPHRDDIYFYLKDKSMEQFASRGEKRTLLLALKVTELEIVKTYTLRCPLLLLDDVFSELDNDRQTQLLHLVEPYQTFITTNSEEHFSNFKKAKDVWRFAKGTANKA
ncbi:MAG: DNA replication and repair protein RecF [Candidatus Peregrinibacteria bacterium]|nr:DNA replication and repair protein RecF [Candidatus Peregrinibacteria bacterium]MDZ4244427.1 DNA replication and repair protein RecF [Candidatus Gracilibacteria bacterium]